MVLFHYDDFGPRALAGELIGDDWWSWEGGGSFEPCDAFDVRVAVYDARATEDAKRRYPTVKGKSDYRLVERGDALRFLDATLADLARLGPDLARTRADLARTRQLVLECLPEGTGSGR